VGGDVRGDVLFRLERGGHQRDQRRRHDAVGHQGEGDGETAVQTARRRPPGLGSSLCQHALPRGPDRHGGSPRSGGTGRDDGFTAAKFGWGAIGDSQPRAHG
jgi:hypothetical protein